MLEAGTHWKRVFFAGVVFLALSCSGADAGLPRRLSSARSSNFAGWKEHAGIKCDEGFKDQAICSLGDNRKESLMAPSLTLQQLWTLFRCIRDDRFLRNSSSSVFRRRIAWLYPDDGCSYRAELFRLRVMKMGLPCPMKVFSFGNLTCRTENAGPNEKTVAWAWHVAPLIRVGEVLYVLDPAIDPLQPMTLDAWIEAQISSAADLAGISICDGETFEPASRCSRPERVPAREVLEEEQMYFLAKEWRRQKDLGRDPMIVLGDRPPWASDVSSEHSLSVLSNQF
eukprot:CAMPEP_0196653460 /NCGR_PEP_ID=MMETSP1086-20130531/3085_1 /TAXON_ID=77921 /ORGANISM="Cyanoptyche  gloeocystis , Strain SAG4.97" /LENGTH=282 /DNA_ID=CAMNT_0041984675 /DNA_START=29 /DNA_END=877 /DNA_ORIENTATION=-